MASKIFAFHAKLLTPSSSLLPASTNLKESKEATALTLSSILSTSKLSFISRENER